MTQKFELKTSRAKVLYLMEKVPAVKKDYKLLILLYWQVFDKIDIPKELFSAVLSNGTQPESISRAKRKNNQLLFTSKELEKQIFEFMDAVKA